MKKTQHVEFYRRRLRHGQELRPDEYVGRVVYTDGDARIRFVRCLPEIVNLIEQRGLPPYGLTNEQMEERRKAKQPRRLSVADGFLALNALQFRFVDPPIIATAPQEGEDSDV